MITKEQYKFLKEFNKLAERNAKKDVVLKQYNRAKVSFEQLERVLEKHNKLIPSKPYGFKYDDDDSLDDALRENIYLSSYLEECGLGNLIIKNVDYYAITQNGRIEMYNYRIERFSKIKLPIIAIGVSILSLILSFIALFTK